MAKRKKLSYKGGKKLFAATAKPKARNFQATVQRGGTRL